MKLAMVYITLPNHDAAVAMAATLLEAKLIACGNVLPSVTSVYRWEGRVQQETEVVLLCKTHAQRVDILIAKVEELHPYDCPAILVLSVEQSAKAFAQWVTEETA